ncbi:hydantoinase B/oxoprolinase family protein [Capillimicrobium parvum]|uniref:Acetophenone carboxylase delta subunit n=1 Tax=Capillimicrobium parvum TaxID=2884022 RepID=A0A9E7C2Y0_9ACTN|nr:hydantoinase B/oxoprolinase family protein [Capillimicrobium parvum]UGS39001.1 Acetophenone carboxylase delta subunit [Capillimicrobium parvum]
MTAPVAQTARGADYDPITFSVMLSRFNNIANEMTLTLEYTAWTSILALARDYSCAIYDAVPRQICMFDALPIHTTSMHLVLAEMHRAFEGDVHEGDIFMCNAPYRGNTHVGDVVTAEPVFAEGRHLFWSVTKGHQLDVGAIAPSSIVPGAKNVWQEGLHIPPLKIYDRGKPREDVIDLYLTNLRYRDLLHGDLLAQLGSIGKGRARLEELVSDYGADEVLTYVDHIIDYADRRMAEEVRAIPDGTYTAEAWADSDGADSVNIPIRVSVTVDDDMVRVDYTGSGPQSPSGVNGTFATSQGAAAIPFMYYIDPDIPHNHGCFKHIDAYAPEGTICNATYPAATCCATTCPTDTMHDVVNKAMAAAVPDKVVAGGARAANMPNWAGIDERTGEPWAAMFFNNGGGAGACKGTDGWPILATLAAMGGLKSLVIEQLELLYPLLALEMEAEPDSMGMGEWIGGPGVRWVLRPIAGSAEVVTFGDGQQNPPHGVLGGTMGIGGGQYVEVESTGRRRYVSATGHYLVGPGEVRVGVSTGGGGYGNPIDRDPEQVRRDVRDGLVTRETAAAVCGVVLSDDWDPVIDVAATEARRAELAKVERPMVEPTAPAASTWLERDMREGDEYLLNPTVA